MKEYDELALVTEVGTFGELNIEDPTVETLKKKKTDMEALIEASIAENRDNLTVLMD